jgi:hypothetical protein
MKLLHLGIFTRATALALVMLAFATLSCAAEKQDAASLAKQSQNPVSSLISVPFENNATFNNGNDDHFVNILNIKPVIPMSLTKDWNLINRLIVPLIYTDKPVSDSWVPIGGSGNHTLLKFEEGDNTKFGLGDIAYQGFFTPAKSGKVIWGLGSQINIPTGNDPFTADQWSVGPSAVVLTMPGHWVVGALVSNVWSIGGYNDAPSVNALTAQYFVNYNLKDGWYLSTAPVVTANWQADDSDDRWVVPLGGGVGRVFKVGDQHLKMSLAGYYNVIKPDNASDLNVQFSVTFMFPK